jgi:CHAT domain-containing protein
VLSLWKVDDTATALLMTRFYGNLLGRHEGLSAPMPKAEALAKAKWWLSRLGREEALKLAGGLDEAGERSKGAGRRQPTRTPPVIPPGLGDEGPYAHPYYWAAFILIGDPD